MREPCSKSVAAHTYRKRRGYVVGQGRAGQDSGRKRISQTVRLERRRSPPFGSHQSHYLRWPVAYRALDIRNEHTRILPTLTR